MGRTFVTSLLCFIVSLLIGGFIVQYLAVASNGQEEWIVAFGLTIICACAVTFIFFIVQLAGGTRQAAFFAMLFLLGVIAVIAAGLVYWTFAAANGGQAGNNAALIAGLVTPNAAVVIIQWLIVRARTPADAAAAATAPRFGRGGSPS